MSRYHRQEILAGFGQAGQKRLASSHVVVVGAGGLGCPVIQYLAAAGVGTLTIVDHDRVEESNLHRQVIHTTASIGMPKAESAARFVTELNPEVTTRTVTSGWNVENALELAESADVVIDGSDNFPTRYLVDDACALTETPTVWGSVLQWQGRVSVFDSSVRHRDLFPEPPAAGSTPSCAEAGVIGALCGVIGTMMATETLKLLTGIGSPLVGTLQMFDARTGQVQQIRVNADPRRPAITELTPIDDIPCVLSPAVPEVTCDQILPLLQQPDVTLLDVREEAEFTAYPVPTALHIPLGTLAGQLSTLNPAHRFYTLCHSGMRSLKAAQMLVDNGFTEVSSISGGLAQCGNLLASLRSDEAPDDDNR